MRQPNRRGNRQGQEQQCRVSDPRGEPRNRTFAIDSPRFPTENRPEATRHGQRQHQKSDRLVILEKLN